MGFILVILGGIVLVYILGSIFEQRDKEKEKNRQHSITEQAKANMLNKQYLKVGDYHDGWAVVQLAEFRYAYVNVFGEYLNNAIFVKADDFSQGTAIVRGIDTGVAIIDSKGHYVLPFDKNPKVETSIERIYTGIYKYTKRYYKKPRYVDHTEIYVVKQNGVFVMETPIDEIISVKSNYLKYRKGYLIGELDFSGNSLSRPFRKKEIIDGTLYRVMEEDYAWGVYDEAIDKIIIPCKYSEIQYCKSTDLFIIKPYGDGKRGFPAWVVDRNNQIIIPQKYDYIQPYSDDYLSVTYFSNDGSCNHRHGVITLSGEEVVKPLYERVNRSSKGNFFAIHNKTCGLVDENGYANLEYCYHSEFGTPQDYYVKVSKEGKFGVINLDNNVIIPLIYDQIESVYGENNFVDRYIVKLNNRFGIVDTSGNTITPIQYSFILDHALYFEAIDEDGVTYLLDKNGNEYVECSALSIATKKLIFDAEKRNILFFDTETTGLPKDYNAPVSDVENWPRIVQLSWVLADCNATVLSECNYIIKPNGYDIPKQAESIHGISNAKALAEGYEIKAVLDEFLLAVKHADLIVGHNIDFDVKIVASELCRQNYKDELSTKRRLCTMKISTNLCKLNGKYGYRYPKLQELYKTLFGHNFTNAHNSAADTKATMQCYFELHKRGII